MKFKKTQEELINFLGSNHSIDEVSQSDFIFIEFTGENPHGFESTISVKTRSFVEFLGIETNKTEFYWSYKKDIDDEGSLVVEKVSSI
jgi:hypothetical protein